MNQTKKPEKEEQIFRVMLHETTINKLEGLTKKRYNNNGEKLILEIIKKIPKRSRKNF